MYSPFMEKVRRGLGNMPAQMFPVPVELQNQLDPETLRRLRQQALLQMGLGMMSAGEKGAGLGTGVQYGMAQGREGLGQGLNQAWVAKRSQREDERLDWYQTKTEEAERRRERERAEDKAARVSELGQVQSNWERQFAASREAAARAEEAARRAQSTTDRQQAIFDYNRAMDETRTALGNRIAALRNQGVTDSDPVMKTLLTQYETYAGAKDLRPPGSGNLLLDGMGGAANPFDTAPPPPWAQDQPVQRPPAEAPAVAPPTVTAPQVGLGGSGRPLPEAAYRSVPEINAAITGGAARAITKDDGYTARLNQRMLARLQGISWEEWRSRNGLPPP